MIGATWKTWRVVRCKQEGDKCGQGIRIVADRATWHSKAILQAGVTTTDQFNAHFSMVKPVDSGPQYTPLEDISGKHKQLSFDYPHSPCLKLVRSHILPAVVHREVCSPGVVLVAE
jgi:hypothetical protein